MVDDRGGVHFPVAFFDGDREFVIGDVNIYPSLEFKKFQSVVSEKVGISPNQISIYLVDRKSSKFSPASRLKIPITGKANFAAIALKKDCSFLVVLKRSRRQRKRKPKQSTLEFSDYLPVNKISPSPGKFLLLRRNKPESNDSRNSGYFSPYYHQITPSDFLDYDERVKKLQIREDEYLRTMNLNSNFDLDSVPNLEDGYVDDRGLCEECMNANRRGKAAPFHWCIYDAVTVGFRSSAGPIARPQKACEKALSGQFAF